MDTKMEVIKVNSWRRFLHSLSTTGGDVFVLFLLFMFTASAYLWTHDPKIIEASTLILGALLGLLRGKSNQQITEVETAEQPPKTQTNG